MVFPWTIVVNTTSAFFCSLSEAQKGAEDKVQIKAQLGGTPVTEMTERGHLPLTWRLRPSEVSVVELAIFIDHHVIQ